MKHYSLCSSPSMKLVLWYIFNKNQIHLLLSPYFIVCQRKEKVKGNAELQTFKNSATFAADCCSSKAH